MSLRVNLRIEEDEDWFVATFSLFVEGDEVCSFDIFAPETFKKQDYLDFADKKRESLKFCDSNGNVGMVWMPDGKVRCDVSKHGAGGDGAASCFFPRDLIVPKIKELAEKIK